MATARLHALKTVTALGIIFSLYFSVVEIWKMISEKMVYGALIMPTCFYGLIIYIWVFVLAIKLKNSKGGEHKNETEAKDEYGTNDELKDEHEEENSHIA